MFRCASFPFSLFFEHIKNVNLLIVGAKRKEETEIQKKYKEIVRGIAEGKPTEVLVNEAADFGRTPEDAFRLMKEIETVRRNPDIMSALLKEVANE